MVLPTFRMARPTSVKTLWKPAHRQAQRCDFQLTHSRVWDGDWLSHSICPFIPAVSSSPSPVSPVLHSNLLSTSYVHSYPPTYIPTHERKYAMSVFSLTVVNFNDYVRFCPFLYREHIFFSYVVLWLAYLLSGMNPAMSGWGGGGGESVLIFLLTCPILSMKL